CCGLGCCSLIFLDGYLGGNGTEGVSKTSKPKGERYIRTGERDTWKSGLTPLPLSRCLQETGREGRVPAEGPLPAAVAWVRAAAAASSRRRHRGPAPGRCGPAPGRRRPPQPPLLQRQPGSRPPQTPSRGYSAFVLI
ncbi:hypothetical protein Taro_020772, partial [Colocasia esculenta]|nr:hypothetical protein [Colocasia esculenta]